MKPIIALSVFDGISCGREAFGRAGIPVKKYYASEIDKHAIKVSEKNYPDIIRLGNVENWRSWDIERPDIIIGGSPCQGFSFAGKQLKFDDPRSKLFFVFADILRHYKPDYFLLENVVMDKNCQDIISQTLGEIYPECVKQHDRFSFGKIEPILINSALVSAQNRERLYWTNIPNIEQPQDKGILLKDIIEDGISDERMTNNGKSHCITARYSGACAWNSIERKQRTMILCRDAIYNNREERISGDKTPTLRSGRFGLEIGCKQIGIADISGNETTKRVYALDGKCPTLTAICGGNQEKKISEDGYTWRKLTPIECERLQTLPDNYTEGVSKTQRYRCLGNGWTVDVIAHIFKNLHETMQ